VVGRDGGQQKSPDVKVRAWWLDHAVETMAQFMAPGDVFMARGQRHTVHLVVRKGAAREVLVAGQRADGSQFEATFDWGEIVVTL